MTLVLNAQQIDHIRIANRLVDVMGHPATEFLEHPRHECRRSCQRDVRAEFREQPNVRARNTRIENVAEDRHVESSDESLLLANRECIEQRLRRVFMGAITRVDHAGLQQPRQKMRCAGR